MDMDYKKIVRIVKKRLENAHDIRKSPIRANFFEAEYSFFREHINNQTVLVAGSGLGHDSIEIAKNNKKVIGVELIDQFVKIAKNKIKKLGISNIEFKQDDFRKLDYPNDHFDSVVLNMGTISDFKDKENILREFLRVGKKVYFDFYPPTKKGLMKRKKMYEEEKWKNVRIKGEAVVSDDGLYSESISKKEIENIVKDLGTKVSFYDFYDFSTMAEVTKS